MKKQINKLLALLLAAVMCLSLIACGGGTSSSGTNTSTPSASSQGTSGGDTSGSGYTGESLVIRASIQSAENETQAKAFKVFEDYILEATDGAVTFQVYYSGTLCSSMEELDMIANGSVDFIIPMHVLFANELLYLNMPGFITGDVDEVLAFANYIWFENEYTSALVDEEAINYNLKYLNVNCGGNTAFVGTKAFTGLADMQGQKVGTTTPDAFVAAGMNTVTVEPPDMFESLSRGVCDFSQMAVDGIYAMSWYEACQAMVLDGLTAYGNIFTMRRDLYDGMSAELQAIIDEAAAAAHEEYLKLIKEGQEAMLAEIEASGCAVSSFSDEDAATWGGIRLQADLDGQMAFAEAQGKADECAEFQAIVIEYLNEYLGYNIG